MYMLIIHILGLIQPPLFRRPAGREILLNNPFARESGEHPIQPPPHT